MVRHFIFGFCNSRSTCWFWS